MVINFVHRISSVKSLDKPKASEPITTPILPVKSISLPEVTSDGEEVGFLGKHSMKLEAKEKLEQD